MRAYKIDYSGETEVVAANTAIEALKYYKELTGIGLDDFENDDDINEFPKEEWKDYKIKAHEDDGSGKEFYTLEELMQEVVIPSFMCTSVPD